MCHSGNSQQLLQPVSEYMEFWFLLLKFSKYTLLNKNLMTCQAEIGSHVKGIKFEKDSLQVLKFLGSSLQGFTVSPLIQLVPITFRPTLPEEEAGGGGGTLRLTTSHKLIAFIALIALFVTSIDLFLS